MKKLLVLFATVCLITPSFSAEFVVRKGRNVPIVGSCNTSAECHALGSATPGKGQSIWNLSKDRQVGGPGFKSDRDGIVTKDRTPGRGGRSKRNR